MNNYSAVIDILSGKINHEKLIFEIAKKNPKAVVDAYERINGPRTDSEIIGMAKSGSSKITCIKRYRELTGAGLKESKYHVESLYPFPKPRN